MTPCIICQMNGCFLWTCYSAIYNSEVQHIHTASMNHVLTSALAMSNTCHIGGSAPAGTATKSMMYVQPTHNFALPR